ncbi:hypothetical protein KIW84_050837 [Lathyrus oleraceus]|uniref:Retroviral polymerase SH3-like domain-containing protein n=1 Tax=Pisum sativum TaxID=3888 RepID=A0A9D4WMU5_PEA|nr:hypothetical protein KIW84_050837 [Pisum sativum]
MQNPTFVTRKQQDSLLFMWLITTFSDVVLPRYLARIQRIVDVLESIDDSISHCDQIEDVLDGLPEEYNAIASIIQYRPNLCPVIEAESMLLSYEAKLEKAKKNVLAEPISINVAQAASTTPSSSTQVSQDPSTLAQFRVVPNFGESRGGFRGSRGFQRGRGDMFGGKFKIQCQICIKNGHDASVCYHRHTSMMPTMWQSTPPNQWPAPLLRGPPPGFSQKPTQQPQAYLTGAATKDNSEVVLKVVLNKDDLYSLHSLLPSVPIASINNIIRELPAQCSQDPVLACPHTHHQNGYVERQHKHVVETCLTLLARANLPLKFWDHVCLTITYLINRMPTPILDMKSPYFMLYGIVPDYKHLKTFGCACYPYLRPYSSNKFNLHSQECIFLSYSSSDEGFKCLDPSGRIYISKDVVFNEIKFPYPTQNQWSFSNLNDLILIQTNGKDLYLIIGVSGQMHQLINLLIPTDGSDPPHVNFHPTSPLGHLLNPKLIL